MSFIFAKSFILNREVIHIVSYALGFDTCKTERKIRRMKWIFSM
jgi:hypothetical protein